MEPYFRVSGNLSNAKGLFQIYRNSSVVEPINRLTFIEL